jgi:hypothetical protein
MWYRLLVNCDDYGTMDARPSILISKCFPLKIKAISEANIEKWVQELASAGLIQLYMNDGRRYLYLSKWEKHQQIRAHKSKNPKPVDEGSILISDDINRNHLQANAPVIQSNPNPNPIRNPNPIQARVHAQGVKVSLADNVTMTEDEHQKLISEHGQEATDTMIAILDNYKGSSGKTYKNDYKAILSWVVKRYQEDRQKARTTKSPIAQLKEMYDEEVQHGQG